MNIKFMKAALLTAPRTFALTDLDAPIPQPGELLVRVKRAGVCGSDLHFYETGRIGDVFLKEPFLMGHEFMGVVEDSCGLPHALKPGTRVAVDPAVSCNRCEFCLAGRPNICPKVQFRGFPPYRGAFAEYICIPEENVFPMPDSIPDEAGPVLETLAVAVHCLELVSNVRGKEVALVGAGSVGLLTLLLLKHHGANISLVVEPIAERRKIAESLGIGAAVPPDDKEAIREHIRRSGTFGPEIVFEAAGEPDSFQLSLDICRPGGEVCYCGIYPQGAMPLDFTNARRKELRAVFVRRSLPVNYPEAIRLVAEGHVDISPVITHRFPLHRIADAFDLAEHRRDGVIKAILEIE